MKISLQYFFAILILLNSCTKESMDNASSLSSGTGKGGSLSRFTIAGNYLYAVDNHYLYTYDISDPQKAIKTNTSPMSFDMETIYPFKNRLFIGSKTGLYIYSLDNPAQPVKIGEAKHGRSCDPVVVNDNAAYVTLKGGAGCGPAEDGLYVHDISNIFSPVLMTTIKIATPQGLGIHDKTLYVCCNDKGLRVYNIDKPFSPVEKKVLTDANYKDVIPYGNLLVCFVTTGILLYDISSPENPQLINKINN